MLDASNRQTAICKPSSPPYSPPPPPPQLQNVYRGHFKADVKEGRGIFLWADGSKYEGGFANGHWHGPGTYTWAAGHSFSGDFDSGSVEGMNEIMGR